MLRQGLVAVDLDNPSWLVRLRGEAFRSAWKFWDHAVSWGFRFAGANCAAGASPRASSSLAAPGLSERLPCCHHPVHDDC